MKQLWLLFLPIFCMANEQFEFKSECNNVKYKIVSYCRANNLKDDQDKLSIPICESQKLSIGDVNVDLEKFTGFVERKNLDNKKIEMMGYIFYGASCKKDKIILSASGGCNACGEMFKFFNLKGEVINDENKSIDLNPMEDILPYIPRVE